MDLVQITNTGESDITLPGNQPVHIAAGQTRIVPWDVACAHLGNPVHTTVAERQWEYNLVRVQWGHHEGFDSPEVWDTKKPPLEVSTLDGVRVYMLIDDPAGEMPAPGELMPESLPSTSNDVLVLQAQIARQQEQMSRLEQMLVRMTQGATVDLDPKDTNALATTDNAGADEATVDAGGQQTEAGELPAVQPTDPAAVDGPTASRTRIR